MLPFVLAGCVASWIISNKFMNKKTDFEANVKKRFLKTIEEMKDQPLTNSNRTFGLTDINRTETGFNAKLIIPVGLSEDNFIKIIPFLENSFSSDIEYKSCIVKFINRTNKRSE